MNLYQIDLKAGDGIQPKPVTRYREHLAARVFPETRILQWPTPHGTGYAVLYLPAGASAQRRVPLVVDGYPGEPLSNVDERERKGAEHFTDAIYRFLQSGIAVLDADIEVSAYGVYEQPLKQMAESVMAATDAAVATGVIDDKRLGLMGGSYGGYMVQAVITQTDRFKAAASHAGISDWFGSYLTGVASDKDAPAYHEIGQGRLVKPLWDAPQNYVESSPITYFNKVDTPLLLTHGALDERVPPRLSLESFEGLRRLDKPAVLAQYRRMGHIAKPDVHQRTLAWFREHLLGEAPTAQVAAQKGYFLGGADEKPAEAKTDAPVQPPSK